MLEKMPDLLADHGIASKKLQFVKLVVLSITLGFTLTLTVILTEEKKDLSNLDAIFNLKRPVLSASTQCISVERFNISSSILASTCKINSLTYIDIRRFIDDKASAIGILLNKTEWRLLRQSSEDIDAFFEKH